MAAHASTGLRLRKNVETNKDKPDAGDHAFVMAAGYSEDSTLLSDGQCVLIAALLARRVVCKARKHKLSLHYHDNAFVGSRAIDELLAGKAASSRRAAVKLGQELQKRGFIHHVTFSHKFVDGHRFYAFNHSLATAPPPPVTAPVGSPSHRQQMSAQLRHMKSQQALHNDTNDAHSPVHANWRAASYLRKQRMATAATHIRRAIMMCAMVSVVMTAAFVHSVVTETIKSASPNLFLVSLPFIVLSQLVLALRSLRAAQSDDDDAGDDSDDDDDVVDDTAVAATPTSTASASVAVEARERVSRDREVAENVTSTSSGGDYTVPEVDRMMYGDAYDANAAPNAFATANHWPHRPVLVRVPPHSEITCTDGADANCVRVNDASDVCSFTSDLFTGKAMIRVRDVGGDGGSSGGSTAYFDGKKRLLQTCIQGRFSRRVRFDELVGGQVFARPFVNVPWYVRGFLSAIKLVVPSLKANVLGDKPCLTSPLIALCNELAAHRPGDEPDVTAPVLIEDTRLLGGVFSAETVTAAKRKKMFGKQKNLEAFYFEPDIVCK
jgi:hypothetical protein